MMNRRDELLKIINNDISLLPMVDEILFLEGKLTELKKLPFIKVHPTDQTKQKTTPAAKQYKELLQQYTNCIKVLARASGTDDKDEESPLRKWVRKHVE